MAGRGLHPLFRNASSNSARQQRYADLSTHDDDDDQPKKKDTIEILSGEELGGEIDRRRALFLEHPCAFYSFFGLFMFLVLACASSPTSNRFELPKTGSSSEMCHLPSIFQVDDQGFTYLNSPDICVPGVAKDTCCIDPVASLARGGDPWEKALKLNTELANNYTASSNPLDVVMYGDSITEMWNGRQMGRHGAAWETNLNVFQQLFQKKQGAKVEGLALGIAGDRTYNLLYRLQHGELPPALDPKVWWLFIGHNNAGKEAESCSADSIAAGNMRIVEEIRKHSPQTPIVINSILPCGQEELVHHSPRWAILQTVNTHLKCYADSLENVYFFNATKLFVYNGRTEEYGQGVYVNKTLMNDYVHHTGYGAMVWGSAIVEKVLALTGGES